MKNIFKTIAINVAFAFTAIIIAEVAYKNIVDTDGRVTSSWNTDRYVRLREINPNHLSFVKPDKRYLVTTDSLDDTSRKLETDKDGFIMPSGKESDSIKIIFHGGSTTECIYVQEKLRFPYLVGEKLRQENLSRTIGTWNAGVSGNNVMHSINILLNKSLPLKPTHAILMHNVNDGAVLLNSENGYFENSPEDQFMSSRTLITKPNSKSFLRSYFPLTVTILKKAIGILPSMFTNEISPNEISPKETLAALKSLKPDENIESRRMSILKSFKAKLDTFVAISRSNGVTPILMTQANRVGLLEDIYHLVPNESVLRFKQYGISYKQFREIYHQMNEAIRESAEENNVLLIDLDRNIPSSKDFIYDMVHLNDRGSILAANIIQSHLSTILDNVAVQ